MSLAKHTRGPWTLIPRKIDGVPELRIGAYGDGDSYTEVCGHVHRREDARLIAAAPDMWQALRNFIGFAEYHELEKGNPRLQLQLSEMRAVLAKATQS